jgi:hypothetical protein
MEQYNILTPAKSALGFIDSYNAYLLSCIQDRNLAEIVSYIQQNTVFAPRLCVHLVDEFFNKVKRSHLRLVK